MSRDYKSVQCYCEDENYLENYTESNSDLDDASDTHKSTAAMQKVDATERLAHSAKSRSLWKCSISDNASERSIATEMLKKIDADKMSKISLQNFKLSLVFPEACPISPFFSFFLPVLL